MDGAHTQKRYVAVWCEQHEDLLAEKIDGTFDAFQVKTQLPEAGPVECTTPSLIKSLKRFARHEEKFGTRLRRYAFVSNAAEINTVSERESHRCLSKLIAALRNDTANLPAYARAALDRMVEDTDLTEAALVAVLLKTDVVQGPALNGVNNALHVMFHRLEPCAGWFAYRIEQLREYLLGKVYQASSLGGEDAAAYYVAMTQPDHPELQNKRLTPAEILATVADVGTGGFRYAPGLAQMRARPDQTGKILRQKMRRAGLGYYYDSMLRKTVTVEQEFFALLHNGREDVANQLECVVKDTCDQARLEAEMASAAFGKPMQAGIAQKLDRLAAEHAAKVCHKNADFLMGVAGLLAENCHVWWTGPFKLEKQS